MRAGTVLPSGTWDAAHEVDRVLIDFDRRHRRRILLRTEQGRDVLLDLPQAVRLRHGDGLAVDGGVVRVCARPEPLLEIHTHDEGEMVRIAWHLGNRHLLTEMLPKALRIRRDPVIEAMAEGLGARVIALEAPFNPEGGAYVKADGRAAESHGHNHDHDHAGCHHPDLHHDHGHG